MAFDRARHCEGYSLGVGGVVLRGHEVLLVHRSADGGPGANTWALPGGFVERHEPLDVAVRREMLEESGIDATVEGLMAVLNRAFGDRNDAYFVFLMRANHVDARADGSEVDGARFFTAAELEDLPDLQPLSRVVTTAALAGEVSTLAVLSHSDLPADKAVFLASESVRTAQYGLAGKDTKRGE